MVSIPCTFEKQYPFLIKILYRAVTPKEKHMAWESRGGITYHHAQRPTWGICASVLPALGSATHGSQREDTSSSGHSRTPIEAEVVTAIGALQLLEPRDHQERRGCTILAGLINTDQQNGGGEEPLEHLSALLCAIWTQNEQRQEFQPKMALVTTAQTPSEVRVCIMP